MILALLILIALIVAVDRLWFARIDALAEIDGECGEPWR